MRILDADIDPRASYDQLSPQPTSLLITRDRCHPSNHALALSIISSQMPLLFKISSTVSRAAPLPPMAFVVW
jgi:hypothetical protein